MCDTMTCKAGATHDAQRLRRAGSGDADRSLFRTTLACSFAVAVRFGRERDFHMPTLGVGMPPAGRCAGGHNTPHRPLAIIAFIPYSLGP